MSELIEAVLADAPGERLAGLPVPDRYRAAYIRKQDVSMFGADEQDPDVRRSVHVGEVAMPELAPDEVLMAVMASAVNFNTVWSATFRPVPTFAFLERIGRQSARAARHDRPEQVIGSDASGVIVRTGAAVENWVPGDRVVVSPTYTSGQVTSGSGDGMIADDILAWGYETNFGGMADFAVVKANQLLRKPAHLTWEESAANMLCGMTAYRMLVSPNGARMKQGDIVLIWGAAGGLGGYAVQMVKNGGGIPVAMVGSEERVGLLRELGCEAVINRQEFMNAPGGLKNPKVLRRMGEAIRGLVGEDPHIVFEHTGQETFGASVYLARRGGTVVTCGSSSGYQHDYDNRYLWMKVKRIVGSHGANTAEAHEANRLLSLGMIVPTLSVTYPLTEAGEATRAVQLGRHAGKVGIRCLAPKDGLGVEDPALRARVGERRLGLFRTH
ncbi:crotonyl-CoA carboxylase/reductase [Streptomyces sp. NPDC050509]|uniref:crotonyl-CoA carboxylase/reductase n=1 Tax=Streptomyces sp. NPDC050509 TaxID=3365620 RepID=UPI0037B7CCA9